MVEYGAGVQVSVKNASFAFGETEVLKNVNLVAGPNGVYSVIGSSGQGKSTLFDLLMGFKDTVTGLITLNGLSPDSFVKLNPGVVSYLPQNPAIVQGTIAENVAIGLPDALIDLERVSKLIGFVGLETFVANLELGLQTTLDDRDISGGQAQRLGLARALYSNPKLLLLDEPTSALDPVAEMELGKSLAAISQSCTIILITHRMETARLGRAIFSLEGGKLESVLAGDLDWRNP